MPRRTTLLHMRGETAWEVVSDSMPVLRMVRFRVTGLSK